MVTRNKNREYDSYRDADDLMAVIDGENAHEELVRYEQLLREQLESNAIGTREYYELIEDAEQVYAVGSGRLQHKALDRLNHTNSLRRVGHHIIESLKRK